MSNAYQFASYYTNVNLANGLTVNLAEIELALKRNPGQLEGFILFDQATGKMKSNKGERYVVESCMSSTAFATGWDGFLTEAEGGFSQQAWTETGISRIKQSKISPQDLEILITIAERDKSKYADYLIYNLMRTGSSNSELDHDPKNPLDFNLGITTDFTLLNEMQTGSPASVDYFLQESRNDLGPGRPHALFFSNHGGSYLFGTNGDDDTYDNDEAEQYLQVTELGESLKKAIATDSGNMTRFGLLAYDECLMANIETVAELKDYTRYLLASQELIQGNGYDYFRSLSSYRTQGGLTTQEEIESNSRELALSFIRTYNERNAETDTLSLTDTEAVGDLNQAIRQYADALTASDDTYILTLLSSIILKGTSYYYKWLQDLGNVALISKSTPGASQAIIVASTRILECLDKAIVENNQKYQPIKGYLENASSGLTITLPTRYDQWRHVDHFNSTASDLFKQRAPKFEAQTGWSRVIDKIYPLLLSVQSNSAFEPTRAKRTDADITIKKGTDAWVALQIDGYVKRTSNDPRINNFASILPAVNDARIADLTLELNILTLHERGTIAVNIEDKAGKVKAGWTQAISSEGNIEFDAGLLSSLIKSQKIELGDRVVITPDNTISASYDLDLKIADQALAALSPRQTEDNFSYPTLLNFSLGVNESQEIRFETNSLPPTSDGGQITFFTNIVLLSSEETNKRLTITDQEGRKVDFASNAFISESIRLDPGKVYTCSVELIGDDSHATNSGSSDIALLINPYAPSKDTLRDSTFEVNRSFENWGLIEINPVATEPLLIAELKSESEINSIEDLKEGCRISGIINEHRIDSEASLRKNSDGGSQTFSSGIWTTTNDISLNIFIEGKGAHAAMLGFFEVDTVTGAIRTPGGLISPDNNKQYIDAAIDNLVSPMVSLDGFNKEGGLETKFLAGKNYAVLLITEDGSGNQTTLFSIANANPTKAIQFLGFGNGYWGFEDLVNGRDTFYDGDFNDITFYTT